MRRRSNQLNDSHVEGRVIQLNNQFGLDHLCEKIQPLGIVQPKQVKVKISHSALNYRDLMMVEGLYNPRQLLPLIPCSDGVGRVVELGANSSWELGQRVMPIFSQGWLDGEPTELITQTTLGGPLQGTLRQHAIFDDHGLVPVPDYLTDREAATLGCAALTAWSALVELGKIVSGVRVLCIGTGGVSLFATQIAASLGAEVLLISRSQQKLDQVWAHPHFVPFKEKVIPIHTPKDVAWGKMIKKNYGQVDHIIEVGGAGTLTESLKVVRPGGCISLIGVLSGGKGKINLTPVLMRQIRIQGVIVGHKAGFLRMLKAFEKAQIRPIISDEKFTLSDAKGAFSFLKSAKHIGKIVIDHQ